MRRVLMIHYNFPPLGGVASVRAVKLASYLPHHGWSPTIIAPRAATYHQDLRLDVPEARVVRTRSLEWGRIRGQSSPDVDQRAATNGDRRSALRKLVHQWLYIPDGQIGWYPFAIAAARQALREPGADVIFSSSPPITSHVVARQLHRQSGLPWVAEFRDLWTDWDGNGLRTRLLDRRIERSLIADAAGIVTVSPTYGQVFRDHGATGVSVITNGFDPADFRTPKPPLSRLVTYVGTYYPQTQDLRTALSAIGALASEGALESYSLQIVGDFPPELQSLVRESGLQKRVVSTGFVSHDEALGHIRASSLLLLAGPSGASTPALRGNIAGKVFEYLAARRPIFSVGDPTSDMHRLLRPFARARIVSPGDASGAKNAILDLLHGRDHDDGVSLDEFSHVTLAGRLASALETAFNRVHQGVSH